MAWCYVCLAPLQRGAMIFQRCLLQILVSAGNYGSKYPLLSYLCYLGSLRCLSGSGRHLTWRSLCFVTLAALSMLDRVTDFTSFIYAAAIGAINQFISLNQTQPYSN